MRRAGIPQASFSVGDEGEKSDLSLLREVDERLTITLDTLPVNVG